MSPNENRPGTASGAVRVEDPGAGIDRHSVSRAVDTASLLAAAELVDDLDGQRERESAAFELGVRLGYGHGYDVGEAHGREWWVQMRDTVVSRPQWVSREELLRRRAEPGPLSEAFRERHGAYTGGPVEW